VKLNGARETALPLVDLAAVQRELGPELEAAVTEVIRGQQFVGGPRVASFEGAFAAYLGVGDVVAMANGTDALELALRALEIAPGDEVLVPANTFIATAEAVIAAGGVPRFVDVEEHSGLIDLDCCRERVTPRTRVVIPVHLYGRMVDMQAVRGFAASSDLAVVEDAAQAHGAMRNGRRAGSVSDIGCFSFYPAKNLGAFGDAGAAATNDRRLAQRLRLLRDHGRSDHQTHESIGFNSRMDPLHAAVLIVKLAHLDRWNRQRREVAAWYRELLPADALDPALDEPRADVHHLFPILAESRDALARHLSDAGVQTGVHYRQTVPQTPAFAAYGGSFPQAERRARLQLSLPIHPHLTRSDAELISGLVCRYRAAPRLR
jgi:dTDP-4-amino-4,6-dideoxygalactose transaminase